MAVFNYMMVKQVIQQTIWLTVHQYIILEYKSLFGPENVFESMFFKTPSKFNPPPKSFWMEEREGMGLFLDSKLKTSLNFFNFI